MIAAGEQHLAWWNEAEGAEELDLAPLITQFSSLLFRVAFAVLRNPAEAEDVVQETFVRVLTHRAKLPEICEGKAWLVRIAMNLALDQRRRVRPVLMDEAIEAVAASGAPGADRQVGDAVQLHRVLAAVERLPKTERTVLVLSAFDELSAAEIAEVVGRSPSSVRALLFRARERLKQRLEIGNAAKGGR